MKQLIYSMLIVCPLLTMSQYADQPSESEAQVPYFECILPGGTITSYLPLLSYDVQASIAGNIAEIRLTQTFHNAFNTALEVNYVFPASTQAAVNGVHMRIGKRTIVAEIQEKEEAKKKYNDALEEGKRASLLEQIRPNVFNMKVGNIMPGDTISVVLYYTEFISSTKGNYALRIPTTIGERYSPLIGRNNLASVNPTYVNSTESPYQFHVSVDLHAPVPIKSAKSNTHKIELDVQDAHQWHVTLSPTEQNAANRDFLLEYSLRGESLTSGLLLHEGTDENFFMLQIQPPKEVTLAHVPPREYLFLVDVSGSMSGFPLETAKELMQILLEDLRPTDIFNVMTFASASDQLFKTSQLATPDRIKSAMRFVHTRSSGGGTEMIDALRKLYSSIDNRQISRSIVLVTDGQISAEKEAFKEIAMNLSLANIFAFGIGEDVNHWLIEGVARAGMGEPFIVSDPALAREKAELLSNYIKRPALTNIRVNFNGNQVYELSPRSLPDVLSDRPLTIFGKYDGAFSNDIVISGFSGNEPYQLAISPNTTSHQNPALTYLWARNQLTDMTQYGLENKEDQYIIRDLGLKYHLLTDYTSFVAVDSEVANISGQRTRIDQPLARPASENQQMIFSNNPMTFYSNNSYHSTGAVSRALSNTNINLLLPPQFNLSGPQLLLVWEDQGKGQKTYTVTVKNILDEVLQTFTTTSHSAFISFSELSYQANLFMVSVANDTDQSMEIGIRYLEDLAPEEASLYDPAVRHSQARYEQLLAELVQSNRLPDAFTLIEIAIGHYPESARLLQYREQIWKAISIN